MSDVAGHALAVAVRLLPRHRRDWGEAMQAELAAIEAGRARRRFALGCTRAVLTNRGALRTVALHAIALAFAAVALVLALGYRSVGVRVETIVLVAVLAALAWRGRRSGMLGPVGDTRAARGVRGTGYVVVGGTLMLMLSASGGGHNDPGGWWIAMLAMAAYLATVLYATARATAPELRLAAALALAGLTAWWIPMLLLGSVRAHPQWALSTVAVTVALGLAAGTRRGPHPLLAGLGAGVATCLLIFVAAVGTYAWFPFLAPELPGTAGLTAAARVENNRIESTDPYVAELLLGALLGAVLIAATAAGPAASVRR